MRNEDKLVDGRDLATEEMVERVPVIEEIELGDEQELQNMALRGQLAQEAKDHRGLIMTVMRAILEGETVVVPLLQLEPRELIALEALQEAAKGRDAQLSQFVYASDRRDMLEQALGVLQPTLMMGGDFGRDYEELTKSVETLRQQLSSKEDAQDELLPEVKLLEKEATGEGGGGEDDDGDAGTAADLDDDAPKRASTLAGKPRDRPVEDDTIERPTTLVGGPRDAPIEDDTVERPSTLAGGPRDKPAIDDTVDQPSTLGDEPRADGAGDGGRGKR